MIPTWQIDVAVETSTGLTAPANAVFSTVVYDKPDANFNFPVELFAWASIEDYNDNRDRIVLCDNETDKNVIKQLSIQMLPNQSYDGRALIKAAAEAIWGAGNITDLLI